MKDTPIPLMPNEKLNSVVDYVNMIADRYQNLAIFKMRSKGAFSEHTFNEYRQDCFRLAQALINSGLSGKRILMLAESRYEHIVCLIATMLAGSVYVPVSAETDIEKLAAMSVFVEAESMFVSNETKEIAEKMTLAGVPIKRIINLDDDSADGYIGMIANCTAYDTGAFYGDFDKRVPSVFCFTSGTTGNKPKCVMLSAGNFFASVRHNTYQFVNTASDYVGTNLYSPLPMFHLGWHIVAFFYAFPMGLSMSTSRSPKDCFRDISFYGPLFMQTVPVLGDAIFSFIENEIRVAGDWEWFEQYKKECDDGLHPFEERRELCRKYTGILGKNLVCMSLAGAQTTPQLAKRIEYFGIPATCDYGTTECSIASFDQRKVRKYGAVGRVMPYIEAKIVDGVLFFKGENIMLGYYKNPDATKATLSEDGWYCTGDLAEIDEDGYLFIKGRANNIVVLSNGENIDTDELSGTFLASPAIREIVLLPDLKNNSDTLVALIYPAEGETQETVAKTMADINRTLPLQKRVSRFRLVDKPFEKNEMMKIKRYLYRDAEI